MSRQPRLTDADEGDVKRHFERFAGIGDGAGERELGVTVSDPRSADGGKTSV